MPLLWSEESGLNGKNENLISGMWLLSILKSFFSQHHSSRVYTLSLLSGSEMYMRFRREKKVREWTVNACWGKIFSRLFGNVYTYSSNRHKPNDDEEAYNIMREIRLYVHAAACSTSFCDKSLAWEYCTSKIHFPLNKNIIFFALKHQPWNIICWAFFNGIALKTFSQRLRRKWKNFLLCDFETNLRSSTEALKFEIIFTARIRVRK